jgi:hypothetical protein
MFMLYRRRIKVKAKSKYKLSLIKSFFKNIIINVIVVS